MKAARAHISPYGWIMIFMLLGLGVINFADKAVLGLAAMSIIRELHLSPAHYRLVSGSFFLLYALSSGLVSAWSDRMGTKTALALLATSWAIVQVATVFVFSYPALLLTRIALGAGEGPSYGTSVSAATPWLPADRRAFGLAVVALATQFSWTSNICTITHLPDRSRGMALCLCTAWRDRFALGDTLSTGWARASRCQAHAHI